MSRATITIETIVANDLQIREAGGHRVLDVSLPHQMGRKADAGGWENVGPTTWFQATFWDEHADAVLQSIEKNSLVSVTGYPQLEVYPRTDGTPGGKVLIKSPTLAVVVRRPKTSGSPSAADEAGPQPGSPDDIWNRPTGYTEIHDTERPF